MLQNIQVPVWNKKSALICVLFGVVTDTNNVKCLRLLLHKIKPFMKDIEQEWGVNPHFKTSWL